MNTGITTTPRAKKVMAMLARRKLWYALFRVTVQTEKDRKKNINPPQLIVFKTYPEISVLKKKSDTEIHVLETLDNCLEEKLNDKTTTTTTTTTTEEKKKSDPDKLLRKLKFKDHLHTADTDKSKSSYVTVDGFKDKWKLFVDDMLKYGSPQSVPKYYTDERPTAVISRHGSFKNADGDPVGPMYGVANYCYWAGDTVHNKCLVYSFISDDWNPSKVKNKFTQSSCHGIVLSFCNGSKLMEISKVSELLGKDSHDDALAKAVGATNVKAYTHLHDKTKK